MTLQALFAALCIMCSSPPATAGDSHRSQECFASKAQIIQNHIQGHIRHHKTPNGVCYHVGPKNHSGVFTSIRPENGIGGKRTHTGRTHGSASWRVPAQWSVYPEPPDPKLFDLSRTRDYQDYEKPFRYTDPWK